MRLNDDSQCNYKMPRNIKEEYLNEEITFAVKAVLDDLKGLPIVYLKI